MNQIKSVNSSNSDSNSSGNSNILVSLEKLFLLKDAAIKHRNVSDRQFLAYLIHMNEVFLKKSSL